MILPIVAYGSPVLKKIAKEITSDYPNLNQLIGNMWETMYASNGVGLACFKRLLYLFIRSSYET